MQQRVQKIIAASGFCSRRKAEDFIINGKVTVNGKKITIGDQADPEKDKIMVGKQDIVLEKHVYLLFNKPSGYLTTKSDVWGRRDIMEFFTGLDKSVYPVGRLDRDARGLLLLSSDGDFAQAIMHPSNKMTKTYQATLNMPLRADDARLITEGVVVERRRVAAKIKKIHPKLVEITIHEGRNKIVKKIFNTIGYRVSDLKRVAIGPVRLNVAEGKWRELQEKEIKALTSKQDLSEKEKALIRTPRRPEAREGSRSKKPSGRPAGRRAYHSMTATRDRK